MTDKCNIMYTLHTTYTQSITSPLIHSIVLLVVDWSVPLIEEARVNCATGSVGLTENVTISEHWKVLHSVLQRTIMKNTQILR